MLFVADFNLMNLNLNNYGTRLPASQAGFWGDVLMVVDADGVVDGKPWGEHDSRRRSIPDSTKFKFKFWKAGRLRHIVTIW